jgi:hypothetical protein
MLFNLSRDFLSPLMLFLFPRPAFFAKARVSSEVTMVGWMEEKVLQSCTIAVLFWNFPLFRPTC